MKLLLLIILSIFLLTGCPGRDDQVSDMESIERTVGATSTRAGLQESCSLSRSPSIQSALNINASLQGMVADADQGCQNAVNMLNATEGTTALEQLARNRMAADDWSERMRDLDAEITYLSDPAVNIDGVYDEQIALLQSRLMVARSNMQNSIINIDSSQVSRRSESILGISELISNYQNVMGQCHGADPRAISSIAGSALSVASSLGGFSGGSGLAAGLLVNIVHAITANIETMNDRIRRNLGEARMPAVLICAMESVSRVYCEIKKQKVIVNVREERDEYFASCGMNSGVESFNDISELMPHLKGLFSRVGSNSNMPPGFGTFDPNKPPQNGQQAATPPTGTAATSALGTPPGGFFTANPQVAGGAMQPTGLTGNTPLPTPAPGRSSMNNTTEYLRRINEISRNNLGQIQNYVDTLRNYTEINQNDAPHVIGAKRRLVTTIESLDGAIDNFSKVASDEEGAPTVESIFETEDNNLHLLLERASVHHQAILDSELSQIRAQSGDEDDGRNDYVDYNYSILANASARIAGTQTITDSIRASNDVPEALIEDLNRGRRETAGQLSIADGVATANMRAMSDFVTGNEVNIARVIDQVNSNLNNSNSTASDRDSANNTIQQLCGASLTMYDEGIPDDLRVRCQNFNQVPGRSYDELSRMNWGERACIPIETGIIGDAEDQ